MMKFLFWLFAVCAILELGRGDLRMTLFSFFAALACPVSLRVYEEFFEGGSR